MDRVHYPELSLGLRRGFLGTWGWVLALLALVWCGCGSGAMAAEGRDATDELFASTNVLRVAIELDEAGMNVLRERSSGEEKPRAMAVVRELNEGGRVYTNVGVQLKGYSTFRSIDDRPSLTLKFDRHVSRQTFHGLAKLSLNNALQDSTRLNEVLARELFANAGVPVPRATHALVTLNDRPLGLYVLTEGYDATFLARHFKQANGPLYEGGTLQDVDSGPRLVSGHDVDPKPLQQLIRTCRLSDPAERFQRLALMLEMDSFISMIAMETILCHSDSYSMNRNNYRLYLDPATRRFTFMPHGMDRILGQHRSALNLTILPPQLGLVTRAVLTTPAGRERYFARLGVLVTNWFQPEQLAGRVREMDARIFDLKAEGESRRRVGRLRLAQDHRQDADDIGLRLANRAEDLQAQMSTMIPYYTALRVPRFDTNGLFTLADWTPRPMPHASGTIQVRPETRNGRRVLRLRSTNGPVEVLLVNRLTLPRGTYDIRGRVRAGAFSGSTNAPVRLTAALSRWSSQRFQPLRSELNVEAMESEIVVSSAYAPEEVEVECAIVSELQEVWLDVESLKLVTARPPVP